MKFPVLLKGKVTALTWLPLFSHWQTQHVRYINLITLEHVAYECDTFLEDTDRKWRIFLPNGGSISVPIWFSLINFSRTSAIKRAALYSTLLNCDYQIFQTSSSSLPPWSARKNQVVYHVLIDGHTLFYLTHSRIDSCHFIYWMKYLNFSTGSSSKFRSLILRISPYICSSKCNKSHCMCWYCLHCLIPKFTSLSCVNVFSIKFQYLKSSLLFCIFYCITIR